VQPTLAERLEHIATAISNIRKITKDQTSESFAADLVIRLAAERLLEVISEASRHIPTEAKSREPGIHGAVWPISETGFVMPITRQTLAYCGR
jgi:uncharacterized protein with HEPN domain